MDDHLLPVDGPATRSLTVEPGVELVADVYRPAAPGRFPVLLMRLPYGRKIASAVVLAHPAWYAAHGFIVAVQDVRGRGDSGGAFRILQDDAADGAASLAWAADLPGSTGQVATYGFSYQAMTQLLALAGARRVGGKRPDAMVPVMAAWTVRDDWVREGGVFRLGAHHRWACQMGAEAARLVGDAEAHRELTAAADGPPDLVPHVRHRRHSHLQAWLDDAPATWAPIAPSAALAGDPLDVPALHVGGWQDEMLEGTLAAHAAFAAEAAAPQRLLVGPWLHLPWGRIVGDLDLGPEAVSPIDRATVAFLRRHLQGAEDDTDPVRLFDVGRRAWRGFAAWPRARPPVSLYLGSHGLAATTSGDGLLLVEPGGPCVDHLVHDPWRPAPTVGGPDGGGFTDRTGVDERTDVAAYTTAPLDRPLDLVGRVAAELFVDADRPAHDLHAALSLLGPDDRATTLTTGALRVADAASPGPRTMAMRQVCCTVAAGWRLRLSVQAASWPAFAVHPGTGDRIEDCSPTRRQVTTLRIAHGAGRPSRLMLPVLA
jgi:putative CocE/NonD family hydrolase